MLPSLKRLVFAAIPALALVVVSEIGLRIYYATQHSAEAYAVPHPFLLYTYNRNFSGWHWADHGKWAYVQTNSHGFRTHEFFPKLPGQYRIIVLGDSFMFGRLASQNETLPRVLEALLKKMVSEQIEVLSFGIPSYSGVRYAMIARLYFEFLKPDMVIIAMDQSDFDEDSMRIRDYELDKNGDLLTLKASARLPEGSGIAIDSSRKIIFVPRKSAVRKFITDFGFHHLIDDLTHKISGAKMTALRQKVLDGSPDSPPMITDAELRNSLRELPHTTETSVKGVRVKTAGYAIPYPLEKAINMYRPTFKSLEYVKRECARLGARLYFTTYPYPYMVSTKDSIPFQLERFHSVLDFRANRVHPKLMDAYSAKLGIEHFNAYPIFENATERYYGIWDPHFNAKGYALYAEFLYGKIEATVRKDLSRQREPN